MSCFIVVGFPEDTPGTLRQTRSFVRRLALLGVHDVSIAKFVPYPGSELFKRLQAKGKIALNDEFFASPMDFYSGKAPSYTDAISARRLYLTMIWLFLNFYVISFARRPIRTLTTIAKAVFEGVEETRYSKWLVDRFRTRRRWRKLLRSAT